jgi:hypothetical protein
MVLLVRRISDRIIVSEVTTVEDLQIASKLANASVIKHS